MIKVACDFCTAGGVGNENNLLYLGQLSFECRKVIGFAIGLKKLAPLFSPISIKTKTIARTSHAF